MVAKCANIFRVSPAFLFFNACIEDREEGQARILAIFQGQIPKICSLESGSENVVYAAPDCGDDRFYFLRVNG